jgi:protease I
MATTENDQPLSGTSVAMLVTDGFEQVELTGPREALEAAGANVRIVSEQRGKVQGFHHDAKGDQFDVNLTFDEADPQDFDAVVLPGGVMNGDHIRALPDAQRFVSGMQQEGKPIAAICHGAWLLISAELARGRTLTSWPTLRDDVRNAGGIWIDQEVVVDDNLITSRRPDDIPAFNAKIAEALNRRIAASIHGTRDPQNQVGLSS